MAGIKFVHEEEKEVKLKEHQKFPLIKVKN